MVLLEIDATGLAVFEFERDAPRSIDVDRIAFRIEPLQGMKVEARDVHFLSSDGDVKRSSLAKMRLCIFASIFELLPFVHSSERALLLKVRITSERKQLAYICQGRPTSKACHHS
jgi:hypothetical protein